MKQSKWVSNCLKKTRKVFGLFLASFFMAVFFSHSAFATSDISISSSGTVSFGKVQPSSIGTLATGEDNLSVSTTCIEGANVYASSVNDNGGNNGGNNSTGTSLINLAAKAKDSEGTSAASYTINTSSAAIGSAATLVNNTWGLNTNSNEAASGLYYGLPAFSDSTTPTAIYTGTATSIPVYFGVRVTSTLVPGTYTGQVLYTATVNTACLNYTVTFNKNSTTATGSMESQTILPAGGSLRANSFEYPGYTFLGWSTNPAGKTGTATNGIGTEADVEYENEALFPDATTSPDIEPGDDVTLYAIWRANTVTVTFDRNGDCSAVIHPSATTSCKMKDGNEWIYGNNGEAKTWDTSSCPSGYNFPAQTDFENLIAAQGSGSELYTVLGLSSRRVFWSETGNARYKSGLEVSASGSNISYWLDYDYGESATALYFLCYKTPDTIGSMSNQTFTYNIAQTLSTNAYAMDGYDFLGWSTDPDATTATYTDGQSVTASQLASNITTGDRSVTLYAVWEEATAWMQNFTCSSLTSGQTKDLTDRRDNSVYTVKKFSSDNDSCWMIQNLRLGYDKAYTLTSTYTNITDNGSYYLPQAGYQASLDGTNVATVSFSTSSDNQARVQYATTSDLLAKNSSLANAQDTGYYNFYAATLGKSYFGLNGNVSGYVERDICPKGWQLPVNDSSNHRSWYYFYNTLNGGQHANLVSASGASLLYSGLYNSNSSLDSVGSIGYWWSSTVANTNLSYSLNVLSDGDVDPQGYGGKCLGFAVRCVATQ